MTLLLLTQGLAVTLAVIALVNTGWVWYLTSLLRQPRRIGPPESCEKAAILLCLRGADPMLSSCLKRLMSQDHPDFEVLVAIDSPSDPAWPIVEDAIEKFGNQRLRAWSLSQRRKTCGLKNSSLVELYDRVDPSVGVIVLADADLQSHPTWLRELIAPLADPSVGVTFGNRWFLPSEPTFGSMIRQVWNAPGLIVMSAFKIPWAGSMAIRRSLFDSGEIRDKWCHSIVDDGPVRVAAKAQNRKMQFVPSLIMANREVCDIPFAFNFIRRQLTWTRTYVNGLWPLMMTYHFVALVANVAVFVTALIGWQVDNTLVVVISLLAAAISVTMANIHAALIDTAARKVIRSQGESTAQNESQDTLGMRGLIVLPTIVGLANLLGLIASFYATFARQIVWRGVTYEIRGPWQVKLLSETSPQSAKPTETCNESL
ncbi:glycosyltransferase [Neorhodopirellula lusitana]|uniref:glycosyltransferase n=1 Tax=Neorhodopirellula lusitana TaxID=445327 RepID=UPI00384D3968